MTHAWSRMCAVWQAKGLRGVACHAWVRFWMMFAGHGRAGRLAMRLAAWLASPQARQERLRWMKPCGYFSSTAIINAPRLRFGNHCFLDDGVVVCDLDETGEIILGDGVGILRDAIIHAKSGGKVVIGSYAYVHQRVILSAVKGSIYVGRRVQIASNCAFYPYNHGVELGIPIMQQPNTSSGDIVIGDDAWIGTGAIVLDGVRIGEGAVVGAGSVVTKSIPANAIAVGNPARIVMYRGMKKPHEKPSGAEFDAVMFRAPDGTIRFWNSGAERLYGWTRSEVLGKRSHALLQTLFPEPLPLIEECLNRAGYWEGELVHIRADGSRLNVWSRWELRFDDQGSMPIILEINYPAHAA